MGLLTENKGSARVNILMTSNLKGANSTVSDLCRSLSLHVNIHGSVSLFWEKGSSVFFDIVHIQWPEELFNWQPIDRKDLNDLIDQLEWWMAKGSKVIVTRHNIYPHVLNQLYRDAYEIIYNKTNAVVHFSEASVKNFKSIYGAAKGVGIIHKVIPHPMYDGIANNCSQKEARDLLKVDKDKAVILIFGSIRHKEEQEFILNVYNNLEYANKFMIIPRWFLTTKNSLLQRIFSKINFLFTGFGKNSILQNYLVPEDEIQLYMNASDIVFIPRFEVLNSGVVMLAFSFNKVVVGPSTGSIKELLELSNNPVYQVGNVEDAASKIKKGFELSKKQVQNYSFAKRHMNLAEIVEMYISLYAEVI